MAWLREVCVGETEDGRALAKQTAENVQQAHQKLGQMAEAARLAGLDEVAARLDGAAARLSDTAGLAEEFSGIVEKGENLALLKRLYDTTRAVIAVDLRGPDAAATFDAWFAAMGETGEILAEKGGPWGAILKPYATFIKMLGEVDFFQQIKKAFDMHGSRGVNGSLYRELVKEGYL